MVMVYRTNAYEAPTPWQPSTLDRLSYRLVGHYCLFVNIATALTIAIPLWGGIFLVGYLLYKLACFI